MNFFYLVYLDLTLLHFSHILNISPHTRLDLFQT